MRQGQQNRRGRGRNRSKGQNPLTRSFESNGPDVKIRGTPAHIAEKYISYARDALSSGDPVLAENYLQHAEHYNRIIMAYREQNVPGPGEMINGNGHRMQPGMPGEFQDGDDGGDDDYFEGGGFDSQRIPPQQGQPQAQQQPEGEHHHQQPRYENDGGHRRQQQRGRHHRQRPDRNGDRPNNDRPHNDRPNNERQQHDRPFNDRPPHNDRTHDRAAHEGNRRPPPPQFAPPAVVEEPPAANGREVGRMAGDEQPEFLRRPVRRPRREPAASTHDGDAPGNGNATGDRPEEKID